MDNIYLWNSIIQETFSFLLLLYVTALDDQLHLVQCILYHCEKRLAYPSNSAQIQHLRHFTLFIKTDITHHFHIFFELWGRMGFLCNTEKLFQLFVVLMCTNPACTWRQVSHASYNTVIWWTCWCCKFLNVWLFNKAHVWTKWVLPWSPSLGFKSLFPALVSTRLDSPWPLALVFIAFLKTSDTFLHLLAFCFNCLLILSLLLVT